VLDMNNRLLDEDKGCTINEREVNRKTVLAIKLTECLTRHDQCNGFYEDALTGNYILYCSCICHIRSSKSPEAMAEDTPVGAG
jgi:hypothetical protein